LQVTQTPAVGATEQLPVANATHAPLLSKTWVVAVHDVHFAAVVEQVPQPVKVVAQLTAWAASLRTNKLAVFKQVFISNRLLN
tara:strand:+ start:322 stop:570 length:249 start_codon:yes stop_codon:yes gene_type:complete